MSVKEASVTPHDIAAPWNIRGHRPLDAVFFGTRLVAIKRNCSCQIILRCWLTFHFTPCRRLSPYICTQPTTRVPIWFVFGLHPAAATTAYFRSGASFMFKFNT